mmetsp:Transcript_9035/g.18521  ORF Transcript_9035/g.18521 Transcript_9035/m.18521 type:complete len:225 (+) Transcript_9035:777-1451(+)
MDPPVIAPHRAQRPEVPEHRRHESRDAGDALQQDQPPLHRFHRGVLRLEARHPIEDLVQGVHYPVHSFVAHGQRLVLPQVGQSLVDLLLGPNLVLHQVHDGLLIRAQLRHLGALVRLDLQRMGGVRRAEVFEGGRVAFELLAAVGPTSLLLPHGQGPLRRWAACDARNADRRQCGARAAPRRQGAKGTSGGAPQRGAKHNCRRHRQRSARRRWLQGWAAVGGAA